MDLSLRTYLLMNSGSVSSEKALVSPKLSSAIPFKSGKYTSKKEIVWVSESFLTLEMTAS